MHLGTMLVLLTVVLLIVEIIVALSLGRYSRRVGTKPGGHFLRILARTMGLVVVAQFLDVLTDIGLDMAVETPSHATGIVIEMIALTVVFLAFVWAWWDLTRQDAHR